MDTFRAEVIKINRVSTKDKLGAINKCCLCFKMITSVYRLWFEKLVRETFKNFMNFGEIREMLSVYQSKISRSCQSQTLIH